MADFNDNASDNGSDLTISDFDNDEEVEDILLNEGVDNSAKIIKEELDVLKEEEEADEEVDDDSLDIVEPEVVKKRKYKVFPLLSREEYNGLLADIAFEISESTLLVPKDAHELFNVKSGNSITIATNWILNYKRFPIPGKSIKRTINGTTQLVDPSTLIFEYELNSNAEFTVSSQDFFNNFRGV